MIVAVVQLPFRRPASMKNEVRYWNVERDAQLMEAVEKHTKEQEKRVDWLRVASECSRHPYSCVNRYTQLKLLRFQPDSVDDAVAFPPSLLAEASDEASDMEYQQMKSNPITPRRPSHSSSQSNPGLQHLAAPLMHMEELVENKNEIQNLEEEDEKEEQHQFSSDHDSKSDQEETREEQEKANEEEEQAQAEDYTAAEEHHEDELEEEDLHRRELSSDEEDQRAREEREEKGIAIVGVSESARIPLLAPPPPPSHSRHS